jgi:hypothetical protein
MYCKRDSSKLYYFMHFLTSSKYSYFSPFKGQTAKTLVSIEMHLIDLYFCNFKRQEKLFYYYFIK